MRTSKFHVHTTLCMAGIAAFDQASWSIRMQHTVCSAAHGLVNAAAVQYCVFCKRMGSTLSIPQHGIAGLFYLAAAPMNITICLARVSSLTNCHQMVTQTHTWMLAVRKCPIASKLSTKQYLFRSTHQQACTETQKCATQHSASNHLTCPNQTPPQCKPAPFHDHDKAHMYASGQSACLGHIRHTSPSAEAAPGNATTVPLVPQQHACINLPAM
jgi:hypothetical protein